MLPEYEIVRVEPGSYDVTVEDVVVGRICRRAQVGRNLVKSYLYSGPGRHVELWEGSVANADLDDYDRRAVQNRITRAKTSRKAAVEHLLDAYAAARVALPAVREVCPQPR